MPDAKTTFHGQQRMPVIVAWVAIAGAALALRVPQLADRPMHADEAVLAAKLGEWLDGGSYRYDPTEHHGPALPWLTYPAARLIGVRSYAELTENIIRAVPVFCGMVAVFVPLLLAGSIGRRAAAAAGAFTAVSPATVYYSRYFIPEMLLTALTGLTIGFGYRYVRTGRIAWAIAAGTSAGLMLVTKETAAIAIACMFVAAILTPPAKTVRARHVLAAVAIAIAIPLATVGFADIWHAVQSYANKALAPAGHRHPWYYYLTVLGWGERLLLALAACQIVLGEPRQRFLAVYAAGLALAYSLIPYKTPWCVLGPMQAVILLAGSGVVGFGRRTVIQVCLGLVAVLLAVEAWRASFPLSSDVRNPYAYAHTSRDVYAVRDAIAQLGPNVTIQAVSAENLWPLPWYFRRYPSIGWWRRIEPGFRPADVIIVTPDMEPALAHEIYEVPPPGKRELYRSLFDRPVELRPGVELRAYVRASF